MIKYKWCSAFSPINYYVELNAARGNDSLRSLLFRHSMTHIWPTHRLHPPLLWTLAIPGNHPRRWLFIPIPTRLSVDSHLHLFCHQTIRTTHSHEENFSYFKSAYALTRGVCIEAFIDPSSSIPPPQPISLHIQLYSTKLCASSSSLAASIPFLNATRRTIRFLQMFRLCSLHYYSLLRVERIGCDVAVRNKFLATRKKKHQNWLEVPIKFQAQVEMCTNLLCVINCHWARNWRTSLCS